MFQMRLRYVLGPMSVLPTCATTSASYLLPLLIALEQNADVAVARRNYKIRIGELPFIFHRLAAHLIYRWLVRRLLGLNHHDTESGFKFFRREAAKALCLVATSPGWFWDTEIIANAHLLGSCPRFPHAFSSKTGNGEHGELFQRWFPSRVESCSISMASSREDVSLHVLPTTVVISLSRPSFGERRVCRVVSEKANGPVGTASSNWNAFKKADQCWRGFLTTSGTSALELAFMALGVRPGNEILVPSFTFPTTATSFMRMGALPLWRC